MLNSVLEIYGHRMLMTCLFLTPQAVTLTAESDVSARFLHWHAPLNFPSLRLECKNSFISIFSHSAEVIITILTYTQCSP